MTETRLIMQQLADHGIPCRDDVCGSDKTSFKIGGRLGAYAEPQDAAQLLLAVNTAKKLGCRYYVIGNGSNLLIVDEGVDALFIRPSGSLCEYSIGGRTLSAYCGASFAAVAKASVAEGLMGLEWASGIPGSVGGAVAMNAGAYGGEVKDRIVSVDVICGDRIVTKPVLPDDMGYRRSRFSFPEAIVVKAVFELEPDDGGAAERMRDYNERRRQKQPVELPSAGSTFKRPEGYFAAALIDGAGLKGVSVGGASVSPKHAGFIVNNGGATCGDVLKLIDIVKSKVLADFGVELEPEVRIIK